MKQLCAIAASLVLFTAQAPVPPVIAVPAARVIDGVL
jgi:hypothetical protein